MEMNIEKLVEAQVRRELECMDFRSIIDAQIRDEVRSIFKSTVMPKCKEVANGMIEAEISACLDGEVFTDDGWGKKETHGSFESMFKKTSKLFF